MRILIFRFFWISTLACIDSSICAENAPATWDNELKHGVDWSAAKNFCAAKQMRLPSVKELYSAYRDGLPKENIWFENLVAGDFRFFWASDDLAVLLNDKKFDGSAPTIVFSKGPLGEIIRTASEEKRQKIILKVKRVNVSEVSVRCVR